MKRFYQSEWQDIPFSSFAELSFFKLAGADFYSKFYARFFEKYARFDDMSPRWREQKTYWAQCVAKNLPEGNAADILSVGCGLGFVEQIIMQRRPDANLYCTEVTETPLRWLRGYCPSDRLFIGYVPQCLPAHLQFDVIYCAGIEYVMTDREWITLLVALRQRLKPGGKLLVFSASLQQEAEIERTWWARLRYCRDIARMVYGHIRGKNPQQFWGWMRTRGENNALLERAGFVRIATEPLGKNADCGLFIAEV